MIYFYNQEMMASFFLVFCFHANVNQRFMMKKIVLISLMLKITNYQHHTNHNIFIIECVNYHHIRWIFSLLNSILHII